MKKWEEQGGATGKRYKWTLGFESPSTNQQLYIFISKGEIIGKLTREVLSNGEIKLEDIKLDSSHLVKIAKQKYDLQKGVDWATGYHFTLDSENGKLIVGVLGNDRDSRSTRISFNAQSGEDNQSKS